MVEFIFSWWFKSLLTDITIDNQKQNEKNSKVIGQFQGLYMNYNTGCKRY